MKQGSARPLVLLSGGVDSAVVLALLFRSGHSPSALWVDYGQPAAEAERIASRALAARFHAPWHEAAVGGLASPPAGEFPGRNDLLVALGAAFAGGGAVAVGVHAGTGYADCSPTWVNGWQAHLSSQHTGGMLLAPLTEASKAEVLVMAEELGVPLELAHSCETGPTACGTCSSCADREAFARARA